jgi:aryl-alcohol dehydrogenase-like predicted oxidoreductase
MDYVKLGASGVKVSKLCLGMMSYGTAGWPHHPWVLSEADAQPFLKGALDAGINFFDTADFYSVGASEEILGNFVSKNMKRSDAVIATKVCLAMGDGPNDKGLSRKHIMEAIDASLARLKTDYVDLLYIHRLDHDTPMEEIAEALNDVVRSGRALYLGASSMWTWQFATLREMQKANGWARFQVMQNFYNLCYREEEREMIPYCMSQGVALVPWSPMARGFLAGNRPKGEKGRPPVARPTSWKRAISARSRITPSSPVSRSWRTSLASSRPRSRWPGCWPGASRLPSSGPPSRITCPMPSLHSTSS